MKTDILLFVLLCLQAKILAENFNESAQLGLIEYHNRGLKLTCHYPEDVRDFKMQLLNGTGKQKICELKKDNQVVQMTKELVSCHPQLSKTSVIFFLSDLNSTHTGHYFCSLHITFPPPYQNSTSNGVYVHIYESNSCFHLVLWLSIGIAFLLFFTGIFIGTFFYCVRKKMSQSQSSLHETNSEYMPMAAVTAAKNPGFKGMST
ncbi:inducible T-cell costimulator [Trichosurus vulpecula]|uniref:inducible T-cell costimulator n=1 Tax=Trichosurus vulpecula TaxID=9337 RepID=UPI00186B232C|nr:inducible T-cell costimulator [Trichosurus vulpecula]